MSDAAPATAKTPERDHVDAVFAFGLLLPVAAARLRDVVVKKKCCRPVAEGAVRNRRRGLAALEKRFADMQDKVEPQEVQARVFGWRITTTGGFFAV